MDPIRSAFQLVVLLFSVMVHEISHGAVALMLGDTTAKDEGRLTLNPVKHIDPFGSLLLPLLLVVTGSPILIGWAKPVPYNPMRLKNPKTGAGLIALAGPISNLFLAVVFGLLLNIFQLPFTSPLGETIAIIVYTNILLAVFNFLPIPPLDGSNILFALLPERFRAIRDFLMRYGFMILIALILLGGVGRILGTVTESIFSLIVGQNLF